MPLPAGNLTFLFTDIEGSTRIARALSPDAWASLLRAHDALLDDAVSMHGGTVVKHEGDGCFAAFASASDALDAAAAASRTIAQATWPANAEVRVRMGIHTGPAQLSPDGSDYVGLEVHYAARVAGAGNGRQVVISEATRAGLTRSLPSGASLRAVGPRRLKDFSEPLPLHLLVLPGAADDARSLRALAPTDLPEALSSFVGRQAEVQTVARLLESSRLVTLTGPGGTGKTRLSLRVAEAVADRFPDGVTFVELAPLRDSELIASTVAEALGIAEQPDRPVTEGLVAQFGGRRPLLLLDNMEQLLPAGAAVVAALLHAIPALHLLVSSREPLRLGGEQEYPVPPLSSSDAEALFMDRARLARPDFAPSGGEAEAVAAIARRLEGLPLAIELAAARIKLYPASRILDRLDRALDLLTSGARDLPERQRTLRGAIGWSYELLASEEQTLFRRLAVLVGDWSVASAEAVADPNHSLGIEVIDGLESLVDKSLLRVVPTESGDPVFARHAFVREFAWEALDASDERAGCEERHAVVFRELAIDAGHHLTEAGASDHLPVLDRAIHDLRQAMTWSLQTGQPEVGLSIMGAAWRWWQIRAHLREGTEWAERLLAHPAAQTDTVARLEALAALGGLAYWSMDYDATERAYTERLALAARIGDRRQNAEAHYDQSFVGAVRRDLDLQRREAEAALALYEELGDRVGIIRARQSLVLASFLAGDAQTARALEERNLAAFQETQSWYRVADSLMLISAIDRLEGQPQEAIASARAALRSMPERVGGSTIGALGMIAIVSGESGDAQLAARLTGAIQAVRNESGEALAPVNVLGLPDPVAVVRERLGSTEADRLMADGARLGLDEAVRLALGEAD